MVRDFWRVLVIVMGRYSKSLLWLTTSVTSSIDVSIGSHNDLPEFYIDKSEVLFYELESWQTGQMKNFQSFRNICIRKFVFLCNKRFNFRHHRLTSDFDTCRWWFVTKTCFRSLKLSPQCPKTPEKQSESGFDSISKLLFVQLQSWFLQWRSQLETLH